MPTINLGGVASSLGNAFGTGLSGGIGRGLESLAEKKLSTMLQKGGYDSNTADLLAHLSRQNPQKFPEILAMLGAGGAGAGAGVPQQQQGMEAIGQMPSQQSQPMQQEPQNFAQSIAKGAQKKSSPENVDPKYLDVLSSQRDNLQDMISTTDNMLKTIGKGVKVGIVPGVLSSIAPTLLNKESELFDKDAAHIINLQSAQIKGVPSRFRVQLIEKEKPGLKHSAPVNKQILTRLNREAKEKMKDLVKRYPQLVSEDFQLPGQAQQQSNVFNELPDPAQFNGKKLRDKQTGKILISNGSQWIPAE